MGKPDVTDPILDLLGASLYETDPELSGLAEMEEARQDGKLILIASESLAPTAVREAMGGAFANLYAEGYPPLRMCDARATHPANLWFQEAYQARYGDRRYYKGVDVANYVESLAIRRAREAFATESVPAADLHVNVQPLSGAAANNAVYTACVKPGDVVMGLDLTHGGHLTHGHPLNRSGLFHRVVSYEVDPKTGRLDYDRIVALAREHRPRMIVAGYSAYPWAVDWNRFREAADAAGAVLFADIAHVAGLVAAGVYPSPVGIADVIAFTTHKTLMGPRGAILITTDRDLADRIDRAVFPGEQGGPHVHQIAAKAAVLAMARTPAYAKLQRRIVENAKALADALVACGLTLAYGGTDTHMVLVDLRPHKSPEGCTLTGEVLSRILDLAGLTCNKNTIAGDTNAAHPSAIRLGTPWVTQRGMGKAEMERIAGIVARVVRAAVPFCYTDTGGEIGRAKIDWETQDWARREVRAMLEDYRADLEPPPDPPAHPLAAEYARRKALPRPADKTGLPARFPGEEKAAGPLLLDRSDGEVFTVSGDPHRVLALLAQATTADAYALVPGAGVRGFALGRGGRLLADVTLARLIDDAAGLAHVKVIAGASSDPTVRAWWAAISDGYTLFDDDLISKVEGPVVLYSTIGDFALNLVGKGATAAAAAVLPELAGLAAGACRVFAHDGLPAIAARVDHADGAEFLQVVVSGEQTAALWTKLVAHGIAPVGTAARDARLADLGITFAEGATVEGLVGRADPALFQANKPYFIGIGKASAATRAAGGKSAFSWTETADAPVKRTCLYEKHLALGRKNYIVPFAGWEMPVRYGSIGEEHRAVREAAGLFDVSHMGVLEIAGRGATTFLDVLTTNYVPWLEVGQSHYSYLLDCDGNVLDDIMVYKRGDERYLVVVNAANFDKVWAYLGGVLAGKVLLDREHPIKTAPLKPRVRDLKDAKADKDRRVDLALQGPRSRDLLLSLLDDPQVRRRVRYQRRGEFTETRVSGKDVLLSSTGYTGEPVAFELYAHPDDAPALWDALLARGEALGVKPCGLGARDSLRTEAGLPLYGHELAGTYGIGPGGAGYQGFVKLHKPFFVGKAAYMAAEAARDRQVVRFEIPGKGHRPAKPGDLVLDRNGTVIGHVTSNAALEDRQVGLAYVRATYTRPGSPVAVVAAQVQAAPRVGDRLAVPVHGSIVERFLRKG